MKTLLFLLLLTGSMPGAVQNAVPDHALDIQRLHQHINLQSYVAFARKLGELESSGLYRITSPSGSYWGKYQFGQAALADTRIDCSKQEFLSSKLLQEQALYRYLQKNRLYLAKELRTFVGDTIGGVYITKAGLLAAAHLAGAGHVKEFLYSGGQMVFRDGNDTPITRYLQEFAVYRFRLDTHIKHYISTRYA